MFTDQTTRLNLYQLRVVMVQIIVMRIMKMERIQVINNQAIKIKNNNQAIKSDQEQQV